MTARILLVADDFTGGNAAAAGFAQAGLRAVTVSTQQQEVVVGELLGRFDVIVATTDSRHVTPAIAAARVTDAVLAAGSLALTTNRIDTTLRGNIAASTEALLHAVRAQSRGKVVALCVPAHPAAGRQTVNGTQLLHGRRLEETELASDPLNPIVSSDIIDIVTSGTSLRAATVPLETVTGPEPGLIAALADLAESNDVVVVDALTCDHLDRIARAAATLVSQLRWVSVDPGPFSLSLAHTLGLLDDAAEATAPLLAISGSASEATRTQLRRLISERRVLVVRATFSASDPGRLDVDHVVTDLSQALKAAGPDDVVLLASALEETDVATLPAHLAVSLSGDLASIARRAISNRTIGAIYSTGGDVTVALLAELGASALEIEAEVLPLAVAGTCVGGPWDGLPIVTKGGLIGGPEATVLCIAHLETMRGRPKVRPSGPDTAAAHETPLNVPSFIAPPQSLEERNA